MQLPVMYDLSLECCNCGLIDMYQVRVGFEFLSFEHKLALDADDHLYSRTRRGLDNESAKVDPLNCHNCHMPFLCLRPWVRTRVWIPPKPD